MTLCSLHPPRRHIESVYQRSYNWWLERTNDSMLITPTQTSYWGSVYQRSYNWWLERTNDSMLITPTQTSYWISLSTFLYLMVGTHKWLYAHYTNPDAILNQFINVPIIDGWNAEMTLCSLHHPDVILNQFINVRIIDGWNAQMTLCSLHPPRRHIESVYQRSYNWWLERTNDSMLITPTQNQFINILMVGTHTSCFINVPIIDGWNAQMTLCSLHAPPRRHIESVYQRSYNWWLERTNDSMLITSHPDVILNQFINVPVIDGWNAQMTLCSLHPPRRHIESVYQRSYNWWLERTNDSMLIKPTHTSYWISLSTFL